MDGMRILKLNLLAAVMVACGVAAPAMAALTSTPIEFEPLNDNFSTNFQTEAPNLIHVNSPPSYELDPTSGFWSSGAPFGGSGNPEYFATNGAVAAGGVAGVPDSGVYSAGPFIPIGQTGIDLDEEAFGTLTNNGEQQVIAAVFQAQAKIKEINVVYFGEQWGRGGGGITDTLHFEYTIFQGVMDANITGDAPNQVGDIWLDETNGDIVVNSANGPDFSSQTTVGAAGAVDGNVFRDVRDFDLELLLDKGDLLVLRWVDLDIPGGRDDLLAIDDLSITVTVIVVPEPATAAMSVLAMGAISLRRRRASART